MLVWFHIFSMLILLGLSFYYYRLIHSNVFNFKKFNITILIPFFAFSIFLLDVLFLSVFFQLIDIPFEAISSTYYILETFQFFFITSICLNVFLLRENFKLTLRDDKLVEKIKYLFKKLNI